MNRNLFPALFAAAVTLGWAASLSTATAANPAPTDRELGRLPDGGYYLKDEVDFGLKEDVARDLSPADAGRHPVAHDRLLALHMLVVRNARVTWTDEARGAPQLALQGLQLRLENHGDRHRFGLSARSPGVRDGVVEIRGQGLMIGVELARPCGGLTQKAADAGLLISVTADTVVRLLPPMILTQAQADEVVRILVPLVKDFLAQ